MYDAALDRIFGCLTAEFAFEHCELSCIQRFRRYIHRQLQDVVTVLTVKEVVEELKSFKIADDHHMLLV